MNSTALSAIAQGLRLAAEGIEALAREQARGEEASMPAPRRNTMRAPAQPDQPVNDLERAAARSALQRKGLVLTR